MGNERVLQPLWDLMRDNLGDFLGSPGFVLTVVVLGVYLPGLVFSFVDVVVAKRLTFRECGSVYWRAMKWYGTLFFLSLPLLILVPWQILDVPAEAPTLWEFSRDVVLYFLLGDFLSYWWHRYEHHNAWYATHVHRVHHVDRPPLTIWTAMVVHPVEGATVFLCFHMYGILFPIHLFTFAVAAFSMTAVNMITHCGYRLPVYDSLFAPAAGHDLHHSNRAPTNVSVVLTICDRLFGTFRRADYRSTPPRLTEAVGGGA